MQAAVILPPFADGKLRFTPIRCAAVEVFAVTHSPDTSITVVHP